MTMDIIYLVDRVAHMLVNDQYWLISMQNGLITFSEITEKFFPIIEEYGNLDDADHDTLYSIFQDIDRVIKGRAMDILVKRGKGEVVVDSSGEMLFKEF
jgi:hypothetical protein